MISCNELFYAFKKNDLTFFTGIPDSTFKSWMTFLTDWHGRGLTNIVACNECEAVAIATGYHLSTGKIAVVYMQNSGEGKVVNPITSLCDPDVYSIPVVLMIGWRGEPGKKDEPQHKKMGRIMLPLLRTLDIPYVILPEDGNGIEKVISEIKETAKENRAPVAIVIKRDTIGSYETGKTREAYLEMTREDAIKLLLSKFDGTEVIVATTGKTSRELFEYRREMNQTPSDFYTVGGMGCAASIALGIAIEKPLRKVFVFDGDGSVLMQMGSLSTIGHYKPRNFHHILFDNEAHDSTGGQMTVSSTVNFEKVALGCGYRHVKTVRTRNELLNEIDYMKSLEGPQMIITKIKKGARADLGRPTSTPMENKKVFMKFLRGN